MRSQKNSSLKYCIKCEILLTDETWPSCLRNRSNYICTPCFRAYGKTYHKTDLNYNKKQLNRYYNRKSAVIHAYGDKCNFCGEDKYEKLTIDHINGGGNTHRKELASNIYEWLYNSPIYKDGYQVLCYNCNCSKNVEYKDKYNLKAKKLVIKTYGGNCQECKEDRIERLTIDHKNNDGAEQRRQLHCGTGAKFYRYLIKNNFPDLGLQVLCFNCNCSKLSGYLDTTAGVNA